MKIATQYDIKSERFMREKLPELVVYSSKLDSIMEQTRSRVAELRQEYYEAATLFKEHSSFAGLENLVKELQEVKDFINSINDIKYWLYKKFNKRIKLWSNSAQSYGFLTSIHDNLRYANSATDLPTWWSDHCIRITTLPDSVFEQYFSEEDRAFIIELGRNADKIANKLSREIRVLTELNHTKNDLDIIIVHCSNVYLHSATIDYAEFESLLDKIQKVIESNEQSKTAE